MVPEHLRYTAEHEWVAATGEGRVRIGITHYAQDALGDVVFVQLPEVGAEVGAGDAVGEVESTKSVSEVYSPLAGTVVAVNQAGVDSPELLNSDPYGEGWLFELQLSDPAAVDSLLGAGDYRKLTDA